MGRVKIHGWIGSFEPESEFTEVIMVAHNRCRIETFAHDGLKVDSILPISTVSRVKRSDPKGCKPWAKCPIDFDIPELGWPTEAPPGTIEKLLVMTAREDRGESLFHSHDARHEGDTRPLMFYLAQMAERQPWLFDETK